jgi:ABC-type nickel/cobalt efflux system permease component RcnA
VDASLTTALGAGFLLGLRHAMDADHVAAVSALASQERSPARSCLLGAFWGIGHGVSLLVAGSVVIALKLSISKDVERAAEMAVALVLVLLGGHVLLRALAAFQLHAHEHVHDGQPHSHMHWHVGQTGDHQHVHLVRLGRRPFLLGLLHGMAGSGSLMLLVLATMPSPISAVVYIVIFGLGAAAGMLVLTGLMGIPFALTAERSQTANLAIQALTGAVSLVVGIALACRLAGD